LECSDAQISCIAAKSLAKALEACRPREGFKSIAPKRPEAHGRAIRCAPHRESFNPDEKTSVPRAGRKGYKSTPISEGVDD
jgi:hypothetical protein